MTPLAGHTPDPARLLSRCRVVLVRTQGPINLGLIARLCGNFGITELALVQPLCDPGEEQARWYARGCHHRLLSAQRYELLEQAIADCDAVVGTSARQRDEAITTLLGLRDLPSWLTTRAPHRTALVFGNEADGLAADELALCQASLHIAGGGDYPSFNLSHAVAVTLGGLAELTLPAAPHDPETVPPSAEALAQLIRYWTGSLERCGLFSERSREQWCSRFAAMLRRLDLRKGDVDVLRAAAGQFNLAAYGDRAPEMAHTGRAPWVTETVATSIPQPIPDGPPHG